jgi:hypothetical protein
MYDSESIRIRLMSAKDVIGSFPVCNDGDVGAK